MDYNEGKEFVKSLERLGIDLGNCSPNVIEAWFDTDCMEIKQFLNWISNTITEENVIHADELEEYYENKKKKLVPSDNEYQKTLDEVSKKFSSILDIEENEFDIDIMEDELKILLDDRKKLDNILCSHETLSEKEKLSLAELEKQRIKSKIELEKAEDECYQMSCKLDEINKELHGQIEKCSGKLLEYEYPSTAMHISNVPLNKYTTHYHDVISYFNLLDKKEFVALPEIQSAVKTGSKLGHSVFRDDTNKDLNHLKQKLFKSIQNKNYSEAMKMQLEGELKFLEQFNKYDFINSLGSKQQLEMNIQIKSDRYSILSLALENSALEISEKYIDFPSISKAKKEITILQNKLDMVSEVDTIFTNIFSYHTLFYFMLVINNTDILRSDQFFRSVHSYIANNLMNSELRMESMENIIKQYKLYNDTPLKEKNALVQLLLRLLSPHEVKNKSDLALLNDFKKTEEYFGNYKEFLKFREQIRFIEKNNKLMQDYLTNGPTSEFVVLPFKLYEAFREIGDILNKQNNIVTSSTEIWKTAIKEMTKDEWFKFKRQLWMYFLIQPSKMLTNVRKIQSEVEKLRIETI